MATDLSKEFVEARCDVAAFELSAAFTGKLLRDEVAAALQYFYLLPCPETALLLASVEPKLGTAIGLTLGSRPATKAFGVETSPEQFETYLEEVATRVETVESIRCFILEAGLAGSIRFGFPMSGREDELLARLRLIGLTPPWLTDKKQWLRDTIPRNPAAWRICGTAICIHGWTGTDEHHFDIFGEPDKASSLVTSHFVVDLADETVEFFEILPWFAP